MKLRLFLAVLAIAIRVSGAPLDVLLVAGAAGEKEYATAFSEAVRDWVNACREAGKSFRVLEAAQGSTNQLAELTGVLQAMQPSEHELWIVFIGHGTFDGKDAKFNLQGPDISAGELSGLLSNVKRQVILVNTASSSAPFINALSHQDRIIVTGTKSGWEENYTRFGRFFAKAIADKTADRDKDGQVSLLEAFLTASRRVDDFYKEEKRLATEHALIDDNGDGKGTPATFFRGVRPDKKPEEAANVDGFRAHQIHFLPSEWEANLSPELRKRRNELELQLEKLRPLRLELNEDEYLKRIEPILIELSRLYLEAERSASETTPQGSEAGPP